MADQPTRHVNDTPMANRAELWYRMKANRGQFQVLQQTEQGLEFLPPTEREIYHYRAGAIRFTNNNTTMEVYASNLDRTYILLANSTHLVAAVRVSDDKGISVRTLFEANAMQPPPALEGKANSVGTFFVKATGAEATYMVTDDAFVVAKQISAMALHHQTNNQRTHSIDGAATVSTANMDIVRQASLPTNIIDETRRAATNRNLLFQDDRVHQRNRWERALRDLQVEYTRLSQVKRLSQRKNKIK